MSARDPWGTHGVLGVKGTSCICHLIANTSKVALRDHHIREDLRRCQRPCTYTCIILHRAGEASRIITIFQMCKLSIRDREPIVAKSPIWNSNPGLTLALEVLGSQNMNFCIPPRQGQGGMGRV